jgi:hypothetical protein
MIKLMTIRGQADRRPRREPLPVPGEWPDNATGAERFDPVWMQFLRDEGKDAVRQRIDALRPRDPEDQR